MYVYVHKPMKLILIAIRHTVYSFTTFTALQWTLLLILGSFVLFTLSLKAFY